MNRGPIEDFESHWSAAEWRLARMERHRALVRMLMALWFGMGLIGTGAVCYTMLALYLGWIGAR